MAQSHQVHIDDITSREIELAASAKDEKKLVIRITATLTSYVVYKDKLVQVFTNVAAAVKRYNS